MNGDARMTDSIRSTISPKQCPDQIVCCETSSYVFETGAPRLSTTTLSHLPYGHRVFRCCHYYRRETLPNAQKQNTINGRSIESETTQSRTVDHECLQSQG
jgi:hypothetical protein